MITTFRLRGIPLARNALESTPASSDEEGRKDTRTVRFLIPPSEEVEKALAASTSIEGKNNHKVEEMVTKRARQTTRR